MLGSFIDETLYTVHYGVLGSFIDETLYIVHCTKNYTVYKTINCIVYSEMHVGKNNWRARILRVIGVLSSRVNDWLTGLGGSKK